MFLVGTHENRYKLSLTTKRSNSLNFNNQSYFKKKKERKTYKPKAKGVENKLSNKTKPLEQVSYHLNTKNQQHPDQIHIVSRNRQ